MRCSFLAVPLLTLCCASTAEAADIPSTSIKIDVGQYEGEWALQKFDPDYQSKQRFLPADNLECSLAHGETELHYRGSCAFGNLAAGNYVLTMHGNHGAQGFFSLSEDGTVTPTLDGYLLEGGNRSLRLKTKDVSACLNGYAGSVGFERTVGPTSKDDPVCGKILTWHLPAGFKYKFGFAGMWVAESGGDLFTDRSDLVTFSYATRRLELQTTKLDVHPVGSVPADTEWIVMSDGDKIPKSHTAPAVVAVMKNVVSKFSAKSKTGDCAGREFNLNNPLCSMNFVATGDCSASATGTRIKDLGDMVFKPICK